MLVRRNAQHAILRYCQNLETLTTEYRRTQSLPNRPFYSVRKVVEEEAGRERCLFIGQKMKTVKTRKAKFVGAEVVRRMGQW